MSKGSQRSLLIVNHGSDFLHLKLLLPAFYYSQAHGPAPCGNASVFVPNHVTIFQPYHLIYRKRKPDIMRGSCTQTQAFLFQSRIIHIHAGEPLKRKLSIPETSPATVQHGPAAPFPPSPFLKSLFNQYVKIKEKRKKEQSFNDHPCQSQVNTMRFFKIQEKR